MQAKPHILGFNSTKFFVLVDLLSLRHGGQFAQHFEGHEDEIDDSEDENFDLDKDRDTARTDYAGPLSNPDFNRLRDKFLDRLAEVVSCVKGASHVACVAMADGESQMSLFVSRNDGLSNNDQVFLKKLKEFLEISISSNDREPLHLTKDIQILIAFCSIVNS